MILAYVELGAAFLLTIYVWRMRDLLPRYSLLFAGAICLACICWIVLERILHVDARITTAIGMFVSTGSLVWMAILLVDARSRILVRQYGWFFWILVCQFIWSMGTLTVQLHLW